MKSNIIPFKSSSNWAGGIYLKLQWECLEDGSIWYKFTNIKGGWEEWVKYEDD